MNKNFLTKAVACAVVLSAVIPSTAMAFKGGDYLLRLGGAIMSPQSESDGVSVSAEAAAVAGAGYMVTDNLAVELTATYSLFKHDLELHDGTAVGSLKTLPATLSLQYHFLPRETFQPYVGLGLSHVSLNGGETEGPWADGRKLSIDDGFGAELQLGLNVMIRPDLYFNADIRYTSISADVTLGDEILGEIDFDPLVFGVHLGFRY